MIYNRFYQQTKYTNQIKHNYHQTLIHNKPNKTPLTKQQINIKSILVASNTNIKIRKRNTKEFTAKKKKAAKEAKETAKQQRKNNPTEEEFFEDMFKL